jgi:predicted NBD/HSP70 family sugar kinase
MWGSVLNGFPVLADLPKSDRQVANRLLWRGPATQAELVARSGLSRTTVIAALQHLTNDGNAEIFGEVETQRDGRRANLYRLTPRAGLAVGIEIGRQHVTATVVDAGHQPIYQREEPLAARAETHPSDVLQQGAEAAVQAAESTQAAGRILGVGIGLPLPIRSDGRPASKTFRPQWAEIDPCRELTQGIDFAPVYVANRIDLGALGEYAFGHGRGRQNLTYVKLGIGIGAGTVQNGRLHTGASGVTGEIGHVTIDYRGMLCSCGNRGCLEVYAGGEVMLGEARQAGLGIDSVAALAQSATAGDTASQRIIAEAAAKIGVVLGTLVNINSPGLIVLGGSLSAAGDLLTSPLRQAMSQSCFSASMDALEIEVAQLGRLASASGGAALVFERVAATRLR